MKILTDRDMEIFDKAYNLGFYAGELAMRRRALVVTYRHEAIAAGIRISITRGNAWFKVAKED